MALGRNLGVAMALAGLVPVGCVDRRFVIESNVPNAQVYIDNKSIGAAPAHAPFEYYGYYTVTLVHPGYETLTQRVHVHAPWYAYPPFDFLAEVMWPFHIRDTRRYHFQLQESTMTRVEDLVNNADALRARGWNLPQAERPAQPKSIPIPPPFIEPDSGMLETNPSPPPDLVPRVRP